MKFRGVEVEYAENLERSNGPRYYQVSPEAVENWIANGGKYRIEDGMVILEWDDPEEDEA